MIGRPHAIAEDNFAARALGLPERAAGCKLRAGRSDRRAGRIRSGGIMLAFFANVSPFNFYGFIRWRLAASATTAAPSWRLALGCSNRRELPGGRVFLRRVFGVFIVVLLIVPQACSANRRRDGSDVAGRGAGWRQRHGRQTPRQFVGKLAPFAGCSAGLPAAVDRQRYFGLIIGRAAVYWVLVSA